MSNQWWGNKFNDFWAKKVGKNTALKDKIDFYNFVAAEIKNAEQKVKQDLLAIADKGEYEDMRREITDYFSD